MQSFVFLQLFGGGFFFFSLVLPFFSFHPGAKPGFTCVTWAVQNDWDSGGGKKKKEE